MAKLSISALDLRERLVLARMDYNVPLQGRTVGDDYRLLATLPTLRALIAQQARVVMCSHLGRPKGKVDLR